MYWFLDVAGNVLYVGKAKVLKRRVSSYSQLKRLNGRIRTMVQTAVQVKWKVLESELEALLTEAELIRTYQPPSNVLLKDDKSPLYIHITKETFPKVVRLRKKELVKQKITGTVLGPFPSAYKVNEVLKIARTIFPWCSKGYNPADPTPCFEYHLDLCPGVCVGKISAKDYQDIMTNLSTFLKGKKKDVVKRMTEQLHQAAKEERFETAAKLRDKIALITEVTGSSYKLKPELSTAALTATIATDGRAYLRSLLNMHANVPRTAELTRIEGYDVSNTQGTLASVGMVVFTDGRADNGQYRMFNIRTLDTPNDYHMLQEALTRRQNHRGWGIPDLIVIDGGKGQVRAVLKVWGWQCPVIGIAKDPDRLIIPNISPTDPRPVTKTKIEYAEVKLPPTHPALKLVQQIRDEVHRFSNTHHGKRRVREMFA